MDGQHNLCQVVPSEGPHLTISHVPGSQPDAGAPCCEDSVKIVHARSGRGRYRDSSWWESSTSKPVTPLPSSRTEVATGA